MACVQWKTLPGALRGQQKHSILMERSHFPSISVCAAARR
jgi:hypothetical protein